MQGDFQRTYIMMRPLDMQQSASTGFCRVEREKNRGKLVFNVQGMGSDDQLHGVMIRQDGGQLTIKDCGKVALDMRGQGNTTREIDHMVSTTGAGYQAVGVVSVASGQPKLLLIGFFGKGKAVDKAEIEGACAVALGFKPAVALPKDEPVAAKVAAEQPAPAASKETVSIKREEAPAIIVEEEPVKPVFEALAEQPAPDVPESIWSTPPMEDGDFPAVGLPEELEGVIWPESTQSLRELFERFDVVSPVTGNDAEIFIRIPMNESVAGVDHYLLGVRLAGGMVVAVGYAIPGTADAPPTGLVGYTFTETPLGGYWIKWEDVATAS